MIIKVATMNKIGLFGGTFDPPHLAHLIIAQIFVDKFDLDKCFFVLANVSPFKNKKDVYKTSNIHRLNMLKLSLKHNNKFIPELFEINRSGVSYTIDTINHFRIQYPRSELFLLIGTDQALKFRKWKNWGMILDIVNVCVADRFKHPTKRQLETISKNLSHNGRQPLWLGNPIIDISSSIIRERIKKRESIKYFVTNDVEVYIKKNNLYL